MKPRTVIVCLDNPTPVVAYRVRAFVSEIERRGLAGGLHVQVVLVTAHEESYGWIETDVTEHYPDIPATVLNPGLDRAARGRRFSWHALRSAFRFLRFLRRRRPALVLVEGYDRTESIAAVLTAWLFRWRVGVMHDAHFAFAERRRPSLEWLKSLLVRRYHFFLCSGSDCAAYTQFLAGPGRPIYRRAWDIVDNETIAHRAADDAGDAELFSHLGVAAGKRYFLVAARFIPHKNLATLIEAYARYAGEADDALALILCGKGPLENELRARADALKLGDRVRIVPWLDYERVPRAARLAAAVILPSVREQWGMIVNEALAAGAPVLVSNRCGARELVQSGVNGFTFEPLDTGHLARLLHFVATDEALREGLAAAARSSLTDWSGERMAKIWLRAVEDQGVLP